jgi:hypothetical protein
VISKLYRDMVLGAAVDHVEGLPYQGSPAHAVEYGDGPIVERGNEFAVAALYGLSDNDRPVVVGPTLSPDDPWSGIYAACLGQLPTEPNLDLTKTGRYVQEFHFEGVVDVQRPAVSGSAADLIRRIQTSDSWTPRQATLVKLASGLEPNTGIRVGGATPTLLPGQRFAALDAGPNIVVVCTARDIDDLALLWNLRAAHSDRYVAPIGLLIDEFDPRGLSTIIAADRFCRQGIPHRNLYVTSTSIGIEQLRYIIPGQPPYAGIEATTPEQLVALGPAPARHHSEVITWDNGRATLIPIAPQDRAELDQLLSTNFQHNLFVDLSVASHEFPAAPDVRAAGLNQEFFAGSSLFESAATSSSKRSRGQTAYSWCGLLVHIEESI